MSSCLILPSQMVFKQLKFEIYRTTSQMQAFLANFMTQAGQTADSRKTYVHGIEACQMGFEC